MPSLWKFVCCPMRQNVLNNAVSKDSPLNAGTLNTHWGNYSSLKNLTDYTCKLHAESISLSVTLHGHVPVLIDF